MRKWNPDVTGLGWGVVALILATSGLNHAITGKIWGRIRGDGLAPALEGWPVILMGLAEAAAGVFLAYRLLRKR